MLVSLPAVGSDAVRFLYTSCLTAAFRSTSAIDAKARRHLASPHTQPTASRKYAITRICFSRGGALDADGGGCESGARPTPCIRGGRRGSTRRVRRPPYLRLPHGRRWAAHYVVAFRESSTNWSRKREAARIPQNFRARTYFLCSNFARLSRLLSTVAQHCLFGTFSRCSYL